MKPIMLHASITLDEEALIDLIRRAILSANGKDSLRESQIRASQHANLRGQRIPEDKGLLVDAREASRLLQVSARKLWTMYNSGQMPAPIRIGRTVRWSYEELQAWVNAGGPPVKDWKWPQ